MKDDESLRRQIIVCCDGTNNTLTGGPEDTNVVILHNHLAAQPDKPGFRRVLYYDPGVGSSGLLPPVGPIDWIARNLKRISGLASGGGVFDNIAEAYLFLMRQWRGSQDDIYLFGFSRGAFTVRAVAGMVNLFGIVRPEYEALVPTLVHLYFAPSGKAPAGLVARLTRRLHAATSRRHAAAAEPGGHSRLAGDGRASLAAEVTRNFAGPGRSDAWVHWIGVWDTVESVGLPGPFSKVNPSPPTFADKRFRHVRHALALDEHRWPFMPRLYEEPGDVDGERSLEQRWFPGVHCDIGGSYPPAESGISFAALDWMIDGVAADLGIEPIRRAEADAKVEMWRHDPLWEMPYWALAGMSLRNMHLEFEHAGAPTVSFKPIAGRPEASDPSIRSTWDRRRALWPVGLSLLLGSIALVVSGLCLLPEPRPAWYDVGAYAGAIEAAAVFTSQQLDALRGGGLLVAGSRPWDGPLQDVQPGWAMFWDLIYVACWGYLVARITSRAYAWIAGHRNVRSTRPWWLPLGFAPMTAVSGDVVEDLSVWLAMASHWIGTDGIAVAVLWLGGCAALLKWLGLAGCVALLAVRVWLALVRKPGRPAPAVSA